MQLIQSRRGAIWALFGAGVLALAGCGGHSVANVGSGGHGGGGGRGGGAGSAVGGSGGSAGQSGVAGSGGTAGTAGAGGSGGSAGAAGGATGGSGGGGSSGGATAGTGGVGGSTSGTGGTGGGSGGSANGGATAGTGGSGTGGATGGTAGAGTGGATGGTGGSGTGGATGGTSGAAGTGGATGGTGGSGTGGTGGAPSCALPPTDGGAGGSGGSGGALPDSVTFFPNVTVSTLTGGATAGAMNGAASVATFANPVNVIIGPSGALVVSDFDNNLLRGVAVDGTASTLTQEAGFTRPFGLAVAGTNLYAQTDSNASGVHTATSSSIWRIDTGTGVATVVGLDVGRPRGLAALSDGRLVLGDVPNQRVRLFDPSTGTATDLAGVMGCPGSVTGTGVNARFVEPYGVAVLAGNRIIVADWGAHLLREVSLAGVVTAFAGDGFPGTIDGPRASARFVNPQSLAADASGAVYVSDVGAHRIRRIAADGSVTTVAGDGVAGYREGAGNVAEFFGQEGISVSVDGKTLYVADGTLGDEPPGPYNRIRKITIGP